MLLDVTFLSGPTEWCAADAGVPMRMKVDGPEIIRGPEEFPRKVKVRRGGNVTVVDGENINSFNREEDTIGLNAEVIGRFSAEVEACISAFANSQAKGSWTLTGTDGAILETGDITDHWLNFPLFTPFFRSVAGLSKAQYARFGDRVLFTANAPTPKTKQTFLAEPDRE